MFYQDAVQRASVLTDGGAGGLDPFSQRALRQSGYGLDISEHLAGEIERSRNSEFIWKGNLDTGACTSSSSSDSGIGPMEDRLGWILASQRRIQKQLKRLGDGQKDVSKLILDIHEAMTGVGGDVGVRSRLPARDAHTATPEKGEEREPNASDSDHSGKHRNLTIDEDWVFNAPSSGRPSIVSKRSSCEGRGSTYAGRGSTCVGVTSTSLMPLSATSSARTSLTSANRTSLRSLNSTSLTQIEHAPSGDNPELREVQEKEVLPLSQGPKSLTTPIGKVEPPDDLPDDLPVYEERDEEDVNPRLSRRSETNEGIDITPMPSDAAWVEDLKLKKAKIREIEASYRICQTDGDEGVETQVMSTSAHEFLHGENTAPYVLHGTGSNPRAWRPPPSLPQDWPGMLKLHGALTIDRNKRNSGMNSLFIEDARGIHGQDMLGIENSIVMNLNTKRSRHGFYGEIVMRPMSVRRILLDVMGLVVLAYDLFLTPLILAFELELVGSLRTFAWVSVSFWMTDVLASLCTGYYNNGLLEMRASRVVSRYLKSWFPLDATVIICDLFSLLSSSSDPHDSKAAGLLRFSKLSRLIRIVTVVRLIRLADISVRLTDWGITQRWVMVADIAKLLLGILWISHVVACAWFAVGTHLSTDTGGRWVFDEAFKGSRYIDMSLKYQYSTSLHWVLAQITPGSMNVQPQNTTERIFNVICLLCGLFFFTSLISSLSTKMVHFRMMKQEEAMMFVRLRKYLQQESIGHQLAVTVQKQLRERLRKQKMLAAEDVPAIALLSLSTRMEVHFEVCKPHLRNYPFFHLWANIDVSSFRKFCYKAVSFTDLPPGETLFLPGSPAKEAYLVCDGSITYHTEVSSGMDRRSSVMPPPPSSRFSEPVERMDSNEDPEYKGMIATASHSFANMLLRRTGRSIRSHIRSERTALSDADSERMESDNFTTPVEKGAWLCEGVLWTHWIHVGTAIAVSRCKLLACNGSHFVKELMAHRLTQPIAMEYGACYHARLIRSYPPHAPPPDDLQVPKTSPEEILTCLEQNVRCFVSCIAFNTLGQQASGFMGHKGKMNAKCTEELGVEVIEGKTFLTFDPTYTVKRVVQLSIAVITTNSEQILVQLGREEETVAGTRIRFSAVYPGIKQIGKETPHETTSRLLQTTLAPLLPGLQMGLSYLETEYKLSSRYNLQTKYLRTVQECKVDSSFIKQRGRLTFVKPMSSVCSGTTSAFSTTGKSKHSMSQCSEGQLTTSMRSSAQTENLTERAMFLRKLRPRRVLQNVFGYFGDVDPVEIVEKLSLFILRDDDGHILCAWVNQADFDVLAHPDNEAYLQHWFRDHISLDF